MGKIKENIKLSRPFNARDLGGIVNTEGKTIKEHLFVRSEVLYNLTDKDMDILGNVYGVNAVIDLRTQVEQSEKPDQLLPDWEYLYIPIADEEQLGLTRDRKTMDVIMSGTIPDMVMIYRNLLSSDKTVGQLKKVFEYILGHEKGAVLWHCTAGKDRCGMTAAFLLLILDVDMNTVIQDYLMTNIVAGPLGDKAEAQVLKTTGYPDIAESVKSVFVAREEYIRGAFDAVVDRYGSLDNFIRDGLGIDDETRNAFKSRCLE